jgi:murein DD-endopeptidase MepM/ murein hydrolase activator NlpD
MRFINRFFFLVVLGLPACASVQTPSPPASVASAAVQRAVPGQLTHAIKKGETLWHIAKTYRVDLEDLARLNRINDATQIAAGREILLPTGVHAIATSNNFSGAPATDFIWPAKGKILAYFRQKNNGAGNKGIDITTQKNEDVVASRSGKVSFIGTLAGYGNTIIIDHADGFSSVYCGSETILIKLNDDVQQGTAIAKSGTLPRAPGDALHFEIRKRHKPINPLFFLN